jgi:hypothetical protein
MALTLAAYEANTLTRWLSARLKIETRVTLFIQKIVNKNTLNAAQRVRIAGQFLQDKTREGRSRPLGRTGRQRGSPRPSSTRTAAPSQGSSRERTRPG